MAERHVTPLAYSLQQTMIVGLLVCLLFHFSSGYSLRGADVIDTLDDGMAKREVFMGLRLQCQAHPRNCPGGYQFKRQMPTGISSKEDQNNRARDAFADLTLDDYLKLVESRELMCKTNRKNCPSGADKRNGQGYSSIGEQLNEEYASQDALWQNTLTDIISNLARSRGLTSATRPHQRKPWRRSDVRLSRDFSNGEYPSL